MVRLSVNVNKIATLRNARGADLPNLLQVSRDVLRFGAAGLTVHPRPDHRHIRPEDVAHLHELIGAARDQGADIEFNIEGYPDSRFLRLLEAYPPQQATLVPDAPDVLTSDRGWRISTDTALLQDVIAQLQGMRIRTALFVDAAPRAIEEAKEVGAARVELYTGPYARAATEGPSAAQAALRPYLEAAQRAEALSIELNAGHDLNLSNIGLLLSQVPTIKEVSIGHALLARPSTMGSSTLSASI